MTNATSAPFVKFLISINVNKARRDELVRAGFPTQKPSPSDLKERRERHREAAEAINRDAGRLGREDEWGAIADSGTVLFTKEGQKRVSFTKVAADAEALGFVMISAYVEDVPERGSRFRVWWKREEGAEKMVLSGQERFHLRVMLTGIYDTVYGFDNRRTYEGYTFNAVKPMEASTRRDVRDLRIGEGHMACVLRPDA